MQAEYDNMAHVLTVRLTDAEAIRAGYKDRLPRFIQERAGEILMRDTVQRNTPKPDSLLDDEVIAKLG